MNHVQVAIGIIIKNNKVYITQGQNKDKMWEFPGGKVKKNENIIHGLKRELIEEVGIKIIKFKFLKYIEFNKKSTQLRLNFFLIQKWKGNPYSRERFLYKWISFYDLKFINFLPANFDIINLINEHKNIYVNY
ncbi:NUDIX domain-containing protein [Buchnera aphidicola (Muscaphis stroyani)]|uniref:8-oxo-dGTP diphosphatase n=1 Tax=Buchnera aphidicola (Muscaphis stroyani) TaxID=1241869 RepID=A0A4D6YFA8_9GAMM|nr:NUDIX domain-containing protein [Buchnera aphidicola]QCI24290.1 NUDIX domain-containing protein [Buchnera aphidicola (Muscaphis stroyani)]